MSRSAIGARTAVYGVIGDPVGHSLSPLMHNAAFHAIGVDGVYVAFPVKDLAGAVAGMRALHLGGISVTLPHKVAIMDLLDEVEPTARRIGAVNTVVNADGRLVGFNSDSPGAMTALMEQTPIDGKQVAVLGAGGAARAVAYGVKLHGGRLLIVNRDTAKGGRLAAELDGDCMAPADFTGDGIDILINTTPLGMTPDVDRTPVSDDCLRPGMTVMDIVYNPLETRLLRTARAIGCRVVDGVAMFVHQGAIQFERWTGKTAPVQLMRSTVLSALGANP
ncbi:Shikimate dehydrogenase [Desulfosarcina cetonica]|nr:Shikimate dehydrogenase [Desulfosarcina cetonica]